MKTKALYTCRICHTDYDDKEKALECEKHHYTKLRSLSNYAWKRKDRKNLPEQMHHTKK